MLPPGADAPGSPLSLWQERSGREKVEKTHEPVPDIELICRTREGEYSCVVRYPPWRAEQMTHRTIPVTGKILASLIVAPLLGALVGGVYAFLCGGVHW